MSPQDVVLEDGSQVKPYDVYQRDHKLLNSTRYVVKIQDLGGVLKELNKMILTRKRLDYKETTNSKNMTDHP